MDSTTLLVTALNAGAVTGVGETATQAVKDDHRTLRGLVAEGFAGNHSNDLVFASYDRKPGMCREPLTEAVTESGAEADPAIVVAAQRLLALIDEPGARAGKYTVDPRGAQGVQVGDQNQQANRFTPPLP